jgi:drug/metabolite transporter (DMT)-like permease
MGVGRSYLKYVTALIVFGMNGIVASRIALDSSEIVLLRTVLGSLLLIAAFFLTRRKVRLFEDRRALLWLLISGIAMGASWMFLYEAYQRLGVGIASLAYYCGPVIVMALSPLLFHEELTGSHKAGFLAVLLGMVLVNGRAALSGTMDVWGVSCGIMSAVLYAFMVIFNKKARLSSGLENAMWQLLFASLTVGIFVGVKQGLVIPVKSGDWPAILVLGIINTGLGCYFYFSSIGNLPVRTVAICGYLEPLSAVLFSMVFLGERMTALQILGASLILGGAAFAELSGARPKKGR